MLRAAWTSAGIGCAVPSEGPDGPAGVNHSAGSDFQLFEGNAQNGRNDDSDHGGHLNQTHFRNFFWGWESCANGQCGSDTSLPFGFDYFGVSRSPLLQPAVNGMPEIDRDSGPSPPERNHHKTNRSQAYPHIVTEKKPVEEKDDETNRNNAENQTGDKPEEEERYVRPKRTLGCGVVSSLLPHLEQ